MSADSELSSRPSIIPNFVVETLDDSSSSLPITAINADVVQSLALSSSSLPNQDRDDSIEATDGSSSSSSSIETHCVPSSPVVSFLEEGECNDDDTQIMPVNHPPFEIGNPSSSSQDAPEEFNDDVCDLSEFYQPVNHHPSSSQDAPVNHHHRWPSSYDDSDDDDDDDDEMECSNLLLRRRTLEEPWKKIVEPITGVGAGLWNLGNTCFLNSVLQCFTHTVPLIQSLRSHSFEVFCSCRNHHFCVIRYLNWHVDHALEPSRHPISPFDFLDNLNYFSPYFQRYQQEDAHEFLQAFLNKLEKCCIDRRSNRDDGSISSGSATQDVNIVDLVFNGRLVSELRCCNCNSVSETFESSLGLSLEIEDVDNLWSALDSFTRVEKLEEQLTCDKCNEKVTKEKQLLLDKLPLVAMFHLKRFKSNGIFMEKIFKHVKIPLEIDLKPYMRSSSSQENEVPTKYYLYAFVEHLGVSLAYGHYSSYVRSAPKIWHKFDDVQVTRIDEDNVLSQHSYILFYAREGTQWFSTAYEERMMMSQQVSNSSVSNLLLSPKSVLDPPINNNNNNGECLSDISYENNNNNNDDKSDPCVKTDANVVSLSNEANKDLFLSAGEEVDEYNGELWDPKESSDYDDELCTKKKPSSSSSSQKKKESDSCLAATTTTTSDNNGDDFVSSLLVMGQNQNSSLKQLEGTFCSQLKDMETAKEKNREEEEEEGCRTKSDIVVKETGFVLHDRDDGEADAIPRGCGRELLLLDQTGSPSKKLKTE